MSDSYTLYSLVKNQNFSVSTDTRTIAQGDIFFALQGDSFNGNAYAQEALDKGASWVIVDDANYKINDSCIVVQDTLRALQDIAHIHRKTFTIPVIVVGGSNGKTTTKELIAATLSQKYTVHTTKDNLNNHIGVPLTLLGIREQTQIALIEIGANHPHEHTNLLEIVEPTHVLVTNNGADHLEGFGTLEGVRKANAEIYEWAKKNTAVIFVNKTLSDLVQDSTSPEQYLYPTKQWMSTSELFASGIYDSIPIYSQLFGTYNEDNMLAAISLGEYFGVDIAHIKKSLEEYVPSLKRSQIIKQGSTTVILDCYNANPSSMKLALQDFVSSSVPGKRVLILGDMLEMGDVEADVHKEILEFVQKSQDPNDRVICVGPRFGMYKDMYTFSFFSDSITARAYVNTLDLDDMYVFLKASRGIKLEEVIKEKFLLN